MDANGAAASQDHLQAVEEDEIRAIPIRHYGRWVSAILVLLVAAWIIRMFALSPNISWSAVGHYLTVPDILDEVKERALSYLERAKRV